MAYLAVNENGNEVMFKNEPYFDDRYGKWLNGKTSSLKKKKKELRGLVIMLPVNETNQTIIEDLIGLLS